MTEQKPQERPVYPWSFVATVLIWWFWEKAVVLGPWLLLIWLSFDW